MDKISICVYRDTIEEHNASNNLTEILVTKDFAEQYYNNSDNKDYYKTFDDFLNEYTSDETEDFYEYAKKHNAIIEIEHW